MVRFPKNLKLTANIQRSYQYSHNVSKNAKRVFKQSGLLILKKRVEMRLVFFIMNREGVLFQVHVLFCNPSDLQIIVRDAVKKKRDCVGKSPKLGGEEGLTQTHLLMSTYQVETK